ncbi:hypothetical protein [Herbaspirillum sp.]|uniref:hypothetical protein n=1 Tax=Herbaspirillum sp. TaxID=1890675 RepID=UPI001B0FEF91|nr:hypothetical protein [Herbaspirillum sp.]MBO9537593.1 hypothetical protein [Herbaspirillum sp.]
MVDVRFRLKNLSFADIFFCPIRRAVVPARRRKPVPRSHFAAMQTRRKQTDYRADRKNTVAGKPLFVPLCSNISNYEINYRNLKIENSLIKCVVLKAGKPYISAVGLVFRASSPATICTE